MDVGIFYKDVVMVKGMGWHCGYATFPEFESKHKQVGSQ